MNDNRAVSPVIGQALIIAVVATLSISIVYVSAVSINNAQAAAQDRSAEQTIKQLDSKVSLVGLGYGDSSKRFKISDSTASEMGVNKQGWLRVRVKNKTDTRVLLNRSFRNIEYDNPNTDTVVVYQGGGVWKQSENGSATMLSNPEFSFRKRTVSLSLVAINSSSQSINSEIILKETGERQIYPQPSKNLTNPLENGAISVTIKSRFYTAWGRYFEERTGASVTYEHNRSIVHATLKAPLKKEKVTQAIASKAAGETLVLYNQQSVTGYNSTEGPPSVSSGKSANITFAGDIKIRNNAYIKGSIVTAGQVEIAENGRVTGTIYCTNPDTCVIEKGEKSDEKPPHKKDNKNENEDDEKPPHEKDNKNENEDDEKPPHKKDNENENEDDEKPPHKKDNENENKENKKPPHKKDNKNKNKEDNYNGPVEANVNISADPVGGKIDAMTSEVKENNDNANEKDIKEDILDPSKSSYRLDSGTYYLREMDMRGKTLVMDTTGGDITLVVDNSIRLKNSNIRVVGDGRVNVYVDGSSISVDKSSVIVDTDGDGSNDYKSPQFWVYGSPGISVTFEQCNGCEFTGVIYAPSSDTATSTVSILNDYKYYGGIVANVDKIRNNAQLYYDEALANANVFRSKQSRGEYVTYVHIKVNKITIKND